MLWFHCYLIATGSFCPLYIIHYKFLEAKSASYISFMSLPVPSPEQAGDRESNLLEQSHPVATVICILQILWDPKLQHWDIEWCFSSQLRSDSCHPYNSPHWEGPWSPAEDQREYSSTKATQAFVEIPVTSQLYEQANNCAWMSSLICKILIGNNHSTLMMCSKCLECFNSLNPHTYFIR